MSNDQIQIPDDGPDAPISNEELYLASKANDGNSNIRHALTLALITMAGLTAAGVFSPLAFGIVGATYTAVTAVRGIANNEGGLAKRLYPFGDLSSIAERRDDFQENLDEQQAVADGGSEVTHDE